jgi:polyhydroxybutyrate depolymerase
VAERVSIVALCVLAAACSSGVSSDSASNVGSAADDSTSVGPPTSPSPLEDFVVGGDRPVTVQVPASYDAAMPAPLLIVLHGYGSFGAEASGYLGLDPFAEANGMLTAYPEGTEDPEGNQYWNAREADTAASGVDDATYLADLVAEIADTANIDPNRVFAMGHSNGAFMAYRMACDHPDVFAAVVSLAGAPLQTADECRPPRPLAVLEIHGDGDDTVLYGGGTLGSEVTYPSVADTASLWLVANGCEPAMVDAPESLDLDRVLPGPETLVQASTGCDQGGHVEVWTIVGGGHIPDLSPRFPEEVIGFLLAHPRP